jgi:hypothetical protein
MWWRHTNREQDLDRELRSDLDLETEHQQDNGLSPEQARYAAHRALGNTAYVKEEVRALWSWTSYQRLKQDTIFAFRGMRRNPGFTITAILSLALGMGADTDIFGVVNAVLLRPLPYPHPDRLVMLWEQDRKGGKNFAAPADFQDWRHQNHSFDHLAHSFTLPFPLRAATVRNASRENSCPPTFSPWCCAGTRP